MREEVAFNLAGHGSRANQIYEWLRGAILSGGLRPDERLVEEAIARRARVSRTPVREALQRLEMDGLVRTTSRGVVVTPYSHEELYDLCVAREGMEGLAARLAASSRTDFDLLSFEHIMEETREATEGVDYERLVELNHAFHGTVWTAAKNRYLTGQLTLLRGLIERLQPTTLNFGNRRFQALDEHLELVEALRAGDPQEAEAITRRHFQSAMAIRLANTRTQSARSNARGGA